VCEPVLGGFWKACGKHACHLLQCMMGKHAANMFYTSKPNNTIWDPRLVFWCLMFKTFGNACGKEQRHHEK
jgi:hypothetical protein